MLDNKQTAPRALVCQRGARRRYAVPALLEAEGLLAALYTDSCAFSPAGRLASILRRMSGLPASLRALAARNPGALPRDKIYSSDRPLWSFLPGITADLSPVYQRWGLQGADVVYSMYGEDFQFLEWARAQGAKLIADIFIHPGSNRIIAEESRTFDRHTEQSVEAQAVEDRHSEKLFELADILLCPSGWVAQGVREFAPGCADKIRIIPYGSSLQRAEFINESPAVGRILFAGRDPLRKGLHHLARAAHLLRQTGREIEVRAAGVTEADITWMEHHEEIRCLGPLPADQMRNEYKQADFFVFPSLSEGQAGVVLEAMASGCPVICTWESGIDFDPDCGITVPVRNPDALAEAMMRLIDDRARRNQLAEGALRQSARYSMEAWKKRLADAVREVAVCKEGY